MELCPSVADCPSQDCCERSLWITHLHEQLSTCAVFNTHPDGSNLIFRNIINLIKLVQEELSVIVCSDLSEQPSGGECLALVKLIATLGPLQSYGTKLNNLSEALNIVHLL